MTVYRRWKRRLHGEGLVTKAGEEIGRASVTLNVFGDFTKDSEEQGEVQLDEIYEDGELRMLTGSIPLETTHTLKLDNGEWYRFFAISRDNQTYSIVEGRERDDPQAV
ncbi:MAG TPA: hypothetical protein VLQ48_03270 [Chloroflexia bacterium]|nr:hypothetical protein [Chloroflexia bacterium]